MCTRLAPDGHNHQRRQVARRKEACDGNNLAHTIPKPWTIDR